MGAGNLRILTGSFHVVLKMCYEKVWEECQCTRAYPGKSAWSLVQDPVGSNFQPKIGAIVRHNHEYTMHRFISSRTEVGNDMALGEVVRKLGEDTEKFGGNALARSVNKLGHVRNLAAGPEP
ncbi:hypothetical protein B0H13DRAFT_1879907 [Mycena leptocephala]|nr:hypothetical protein B0H13DRAFT_1879907 [Mycena leptocephala]